MSSHSYSLRSILVLFSGCTRGQAPTWQVFIAEAWDLSQASPYRIFGGQGDMGMDFPLILWFSSAIITPPVYLPHVSFIYHQYYLILVSKGILNNMLFLFLFSYVWSLAVSPSVQFTNWNILCLSICVPCVFHFPVVSPRYFLFGNIFICHFAFPWSKYVPQQYLGSYSCESVYQCLLGSDNMEFDGQVPLFWRNLLPPCFILLKGLINAQFGVHFLLLNPKW